MTQLTKISTAVGTDLPVHAELGASSSSRWFSNACPASVRMSKGHYNGTNPAAEQGTAAHELGEFCLRFGFNARQCLGTVFNKHVVDENMADNVQIYVSYVRSICAQYNVNPMLEKRVVMSSVSHAVYGTADCIIIVGNLLFVLDYKHGFGVVEVENNTQALFYAIAAFDTFNLWQSVTQIVTGIVQPRADHKDGAIRLHTYTNLQLFEWQKLFAHSVQLAQDPNSKPVAGAKQCRYCLARGTCRARWEYMMGLFQDAPLESLSDEEIEFLYENVSSIKSYAEAIEKQALLLGRKGHQFKGYKLVNSITKAKCTDEQQLVEGLTKLGFTKDGLYNQRIKGMSELKKMKGVPHDLVNKCYTKPPPSTTLVSEHDSRPALHNVGRASQQFSPLQD